MPDALTELHGHAGGVRWKLTPEGVFVEGSGIERTAGVPSTVTRAWETYSEAINRWGAEYGVYAELILATMCTETTAKPTARRNEPGWTSDVETPSKVSLGLMQTLISTARSTLHKPDVDTGWLLVPENSIQAGTAYIAQQRAATRLDPPLVACAYNAGGVYDNDSPANRWRLRQYPIGKGEHCDRFVKWFNDAVAVLTAHPTRPTKSLAGFLSGA
jgi:Transglycosylase SLT domain